MSPLAGTKWTKRLHLARYSLAAILLMACFKDARAAEATYPAPEWPAAEPAQMDLNAERLQSARDYSLSAGGSGMILRHGHVVLRWGDQQKLHDIKSATKSFGATALGVALQDGRMQLDAPARSYHPTLGVPPESNQQSGWLDKITIRHLATQTSGFAKPGGYEPLLFEPGTHWHYSDGGPNWLAECITLVYQQDLQEWMFERVFGPIGIARDDLRWRNNQYRDRQLNGIARREFGAGIHCNVEALSRLGYLYLHEGKWNDQQILTPEFVRLATGPIDGVIGLPEWESGGQGNASDHYGLLWWNNADGALPRVPRDAYWAWGLYDSLIIVIPSLDLVMVRGGESGKNLPREEGEDHYAVLAPLIDPVVAAARTSTPQDDNARGTSLPAPYPRSQIVEALTWAPAETIVRLADGSDNWPATWAADDFLYTAYGDGWGFVPRTEEKLSLGFARIAGSADRPQGTNIRSSSGERIGQGPAGEKASGILAVEDTLYVWVRNAQNSRLGWSNDHAQTWRWADWKFETSFGCPVFLNFGRNYAGARDRYVYLYSPDSDSAYDPADRMVLARVPKDSLRDRQAYEFFVRIDDHGEPVWRAAIAERGAVFDYPGRCYRSGITFIEPLQRYLWCQILPESRDERGPRFEGGLGIYDAPEPWGPWTTVYFTEQWDVGPGETASFPSKWVSSDGQTVHLVFSGDDCFSVRKASLRIGRRQTHD